MLYLVCLRQMECTCIKHFLYRIYRLKNIGFCFYNCKAIFFKRSLQTFVLIKVVKVNMRNVVSATNLDKVTIEYFMQTVGLVEMDT